jgi:pimeloyl-ACP methyl ester carboxylesterase
LWPGGGLWASPAAAEAQRPVDYASAVGERVGGDHDHRGSSGSGVVPDRGPAPVEQREPIVVRVHDGPGPAVVALHGGPGAPGSVSRLARDLAGAFHVLEPLQRRSGTVPLTVEQHVADLAAVAPPGSALVGWSWGAMLALSFAARYPGHASAIALVGCGTYDEASRADYERTMVERLGPERSARLAVLRRRLAQARDRDRCRQLFAAIGTLAGAAQAWDPLEASDDLAEPDPWGHDETWADVVRLQEAGVEPAAFGSIRGPVLMLHGDRDPHPGAATRDLLRRFVPQLEYIELEACGHAPWLERRARIPFLALLREWIRAVA